MNRPNFTDCFPTNIPSNISQQDYSYLTYRKYSKELERYCDELERIFAEREQEATDYIMKLKNKEERFSFITDIDSGDVIETVRNLNLGYILTTDICLAITKGIVLEKALYKACDELGKEPSDLTTEQWIEWSMEDE